LTIVVMNIIIIHGSMVHQHPRKVMWTLVHTLLRENVWLVRVLS
jgi:hypothetical protein